LAREWPARHVVYVPATDLALIEPWFQLAFGCQFKTGVRETAVESPVEFGGTIRSSTPDDLSAVAGLEQMLWRLQAGSPSFSGVDVEGEDFDAAWSGHWSEACHPLHAVAELDGRVVGHLVLFERPRGDLRVPDRNVDLSLAGTLPEVRGRGVGSALTAFALTFAHERGFRSMTTDWRSVNLLSSRFWPRRGFRPTFLRLYRSVP
jgi:GNAT superfamily N-acetyltransferase